MLKLKDIFTKIYPGPNFYTQDEKIKASLRKYTLVLNLLGGRENKGIFTKIYPGPKIFLEDLQYHVSVREAYCRDFGIPQQRRRLVLLASRYAPISLQSLPDDDKPKTVRDAISHLPALEAGEASADPFHRACRLSPLNLKRIKVRYFQSD